MKEKILITAATGKTGYQAAAQLLKDGHQVKILVRSKNAKALALQGMGAQIALGDFTDFVALKKAMADVKNVYYCPPFIPNLLKNTQVFIKAAQESKVEAVVNLGQWLADFDDQKSIHTNETKAAYTAFDQSGLNVIHLIPGFFADNTFFVTEFAIHLGLMPLPFGNGKNPAISNEDLGLAIAALLKNPQPYFGQKLRPTGPKSLSAAEMAAVFSKVVGRKVRYVHIPEWMFLKAAFAFAKGFGLDAFAISQIRHYLKEYQLNRFDVGGLTDVVRRLTGKEPDDFETIVRRYVDKSPFREHNFPNWFAAFKKFMALPFQPIPSVRELEKMNQ